jgi:hypothetical protein
MRAAVCAVGILNTGVVLLPNAAAAAPLIELWWNFPLQHNDSRVKQYLHTWPVEQQILVSFITIPFLPY